MFKENDIVIEKENKIKMLVSKRLNETDLYLNSDNSDPNGEYLEVLLINPKTNQKYKDIYHIDEVEFDCDNKDCN